jgi:hypothetical protein
MNESMLNRIISVAYGDSGFIERYRIRKYINRDPEAKRIYLSYRQAAQQVHKLKEEFPSDLLEKSRRKGNIKVFSSYQVLRPAAAFAIILIAAVLAVFSLIDRKPQYSASEVETANIQARESIALVNRILSRTTTSIGNEIISDKVSKPVQKGLNIINNLLIGG